jgi:hypothetical protein
MFPAHSTTTSTYHIPTFTGFASAGGRKCCRNVAAPDCSFGISWKLPIKPSSEANCLCMTVARVSIANRDSLGSVCP